MTENRAILHHLSLRLRRELASDGVARVTRRWSVHSRELLHRKYLQRRFGFEDSWHCYATPASRKYKSLLADMVVALDLVAPVKVVEVGCGLGDIGRLLPANVEYVGFDIDPRIVEAARHRSRNRPNLSFKMGGFAAAEQESSDVVIAVAWIDGLPPDQLVEHLQRMRAATGCRYIIMDAIRHQYEGSWYHGDVMLPDSTEVERVGPPEEQLERELRVLSV